MSKNSSIFLLPFSAPLVRHEFICYDKLTVTELSVFLTYKMKGVGFMKTVNRILPMLLICLFLFSGCAPACTAERAPASPVPTAVPTPEPTPKTPTVTHTVRVIYAYEDGSMMLADQNSSSVYRNKLPDGETYPAGTLLTLTCADSVQATFPESFDKIFAAWRRCTLHR